ncbi:tRNA (adenosine(37)-N6)-dimethylallyltransferase MiaA [Xylanibacillus composti]|uniref:tRNA dimethylallyltransferase n=1 Tax=Xylanibacillus composti TaxID=1572762 RepID=A0A8J4H2T4_9BACL|nr:tRNA (adenosine(37)-N6)-dimethylallyltransferase MiaA [Xylanibacillus composti]MDT9725580.1 tRNA (adenosine(37)-N6)-dimethylallyltransferase MiaA [Xylanibacillus composti]GIQ67673.1 tRNA dimethylallyltransferase [Xylanibacillus composti]
MNNARQKLLVLVGPTAVGKTALSLALAKRFQCEIISGDSMQVYRGMDIGTAKATPEERSMVPHHLIDILDPEEAFSVSDFQALTRQTIAGVQARGRLPFLVGGTGLYVESVCYNYEFSEAESDEAFRSEMQRKAELEGNESLHRELAAIDPQSASRLHPNDVRRVIRALEVYKLTGRTMSDQLSRQQKEPMYDLCLIGLTMDRTILYKRIEERVDLMMREGLLDEVERLIRRGLPRSSVALQALGYKEFLDYFEGSCTLEDAIARLKQDTRRFAKRQLSWFRHMKDIHWFDVTDEQKKVQQIEEISGIIAEKLNLPGND